MIALAVAVAIASLAAGLLVALLLRRAPTLRFQLAGLAILSVIVPLVIVLLSGWVMFHMGDDVKILAVTAGAATAAALAGLLLARSITESIRLVGESAQRLAGGDLGARASSGGAAEISQLADSFNTMAASIEQLFEARRELVAWASHDLRTPLASMQAVLEAIDDGLAEPEDYLPVLGEQVRTLSTLVDDLFELARIDAGALTLELKSIPIATVVSSSLRTIEPEARVRHVRLVSDVDEFTTALIAPEKVERVLLNLLTNAVRHTPSDGAVAIRAATLADQICISVEDTGDGLDAVTQARMFEPFWRADASRSGRRTGLGLAIARGLVEAHGGRMWAERRAEGGARISFTLPVPGS